MALPFTVDEFYGVFREDNTAMWPAQCFLVALAIAALVAALWPRPWSGVAVSAVLGVLWAWIASACHLAFFARTSPAADGFAALSAAGATVFVWQAAFVLGVQPDLGLMAAAVVGIGLLATAGQRPRTSKP
jgi:Family of unknown function (DUF6064)